MKFHFFGKQKKRQSIEDIKSGDIDKATALVHGDRSMLSKLRILVVDDQEFPFSEALQEYQYHIEQMKDATPQKAADFDIVLCDRKGVGKALKSTKQGGALALAIKERFPLKFVALYTSAPEGLFDMEIIKRLDDVVQPGGDVDDFKLILDKWSSKILDPKEQWIRFRTELLKLNIPIHNIANLEEEFVRRYNADELSSFSFEKVKPFLSAVAQGLLIEFLKLAIFRPVTS